MMKKLQLIILYISVLFPLCAFAQQITFHQAKTAAVNFLKYEGVDFSGIIVDTVMTKQVNGHVLIFEIQFHNGTRILVSGHSRCIPILGIMGTDIQSTKISLFDDQGQIPPALQNLLTQYENQIQSCFDNYRDYDMLSDWHQLLVYDSTIQNRTTVVNALLSSQWGQRQSNDKYNPDSFAYNYYVHNNNPNCTDCPAGCVAVAMGQILRYWSTQGIYARNPNLCWSYQWSDMPDKLLYQNGNNTNYEIQRNAVAALLRDCGISVDMKYGCTSSGIPIDSTYVICRAFRNYGFQSYLSERASVTSSVWNYRLQDNLNNGWPILYLGEATVDGHAFVCDGYRTTINSNYKYHINWGWYGRYDGWFTLDDLTPGYSNFTNNQCAVLNIHHTLCWKNLIFGCDKYFILDNTSYSAEETIQNNYHVFSVMQDSYVTLTAGEEIILTDGFYAGNGANFVAKIEACPPDDDGMNGMENPAIGERNYGRDAVLYVSTDNADGLRIHPNPANTTLTVESDSPVREITIYDLTGKTMMTVNVRANDYSSQQAINISSLPAGIYLLRAVTDNGVKTARFVKN